MNLLLMSSALLLTTAVIDSADVPVTYNTRKPTGADMQLSIAA